MPRVSRLVGSTLFHGLTAVASLKLVWDVVFTLALGAFPRPYRRGLIEAQSPTRPRDTILSLFHGLTAVASLKLGNLFLYNPPRPPFPRPYRRSLIEAAVSSASSRSTKQLFHGLTAVASLMRTSQ